MSNLICYDMMKEFVPIQHYLKKRDDNEFTIVSNDRQEIFYLNDTARTFYRMCNGELTIGSIVNEMEREYLVDEDELVSDLIELIRNMQWQDIIIMKERVGI